MIIVFLIDTYEKGRHIVPAHAKRLHGILTRAGHEIRVVGLGQPNSPYKLRRRWIPFYSFFGKLQGMYYAKANSVTLEKAIEGADMVHTFLPFSLEKKGEVVSRLKEVPIMASCALDAKGFQKLAGLGWFSKLKPLTWQALQFSFFQKFKNIFCHSPSICEELERGGYPQRLFVTDFENDSDEKIEKDVLEAYARTIKEDLLTYEDKSRQIFRRNWAVMPSSINPADPYGKNRLPGRIFHSFCYALAIGILFLPNVLFFGLRIKGRKNIKGFKTGAITVSNHLHNVDSTMIGASLAMRHVTFTSMEGNFRLPIMRWFLKWIGVVPIPTSTKALGSFFKKTVDFAKKGHIVHFYPEGSLWHYSKLLRPFKNGAFHMAVNADVPVIPVILGQRPPQGVYRLFRKKPLFTAQILEPVYMDNTLSGQAQITDLKRRTHERMQDALSKYIEA